MKMIRDLLTFATDTLTQNHVEEARRQAQDLLCDFFGLKRVQLYMDLDRPVNEKEWDAVNERLQRRIQREPLQYIHGTVEFYNCLIHVNPSVLIPRHETEILVDKLVKKLELRNLCGKTFWDICTGSGCIGIAIKKRFPDLNVFLSDISHEALNLAYQNAKLNHVEVSLLQGNLLDPFVGQKTDFLACNPPYISSKEFGKLDREVKDFEPYQALVSGDTGLEFYEKFAKQLPTFLHPQALVAFELGTGQGDSIKKLFQDPYWKYKSIENDWAGHSRFFFLENE